MEKEGRKEGRKDTAYSNEDRVVYRSRNYLLTYLLTYSMEQGPS